MITERVILEPAQHARILKQVNELLAVNSSRVSEDVAEPYWAFDFSKMKDLAPGLEAVSEDELLLFIARQDYRESVAIQGINRIIDTVRDISGAIRVKDISRPFAKVQKMLELPRGWQQTEIMDTSFEGTIKLGRKTLELTPDLHHLTVGAYTHGIDMNAGNSDSVRFTLTTNHSILTGSYSPTTTPELYTGSPYVDLEEVLNASAGT